MAAKAFAHNTSSVISKGPCPDCGSSDACHTYDDGHTHCFSCGAHRNNSEGPIQQTQPTSPKRPLTPVRQKTFSGIPWRHISAETTERYGVWVDGDRVYYPMFNTENVHVANKIRAPEKQFTVEGSLKDSGLFGRNAFAPGGQRITITEGQDDAMAVYEMFGRRYPSVSVHSASSAERDVRNDFEFLDSFDEIYICFDADEPGVEAAKRVAALFRPRKTRIVTLRSGKDANEYLSSGETKKFTEEWWAGVPFTPDGLRVGTVLWDDIINQAEHKTIPYPYRGLEEKTFGLRLSELVIVTAETGVGKTSFIKELEHHILTTTAESGEGVGFIHLEESNADTCLGLMSIAANQPLHIPTVKKEVPEQDLREYFDKVINTPRVVMWDHFGSNNLDEVISKIRHMHNLGCKYIVLDHLSILVSGSDNDDRKALDQISTNLKTLCMELDICLIAVIQQNRSGQIRGSAGVEHVANLILKLTRDKTEADPWRRNVTSLLIEKNRFCGRTGPAGFLYYDEASGRLLELSDEEAAIFSSGSTVGESWT